MHARGASPVLVDHLARAFRDFNACGIRFVTTDGRGEIGRSAADRPIFVVLERGVINLVLTDHLPLYWDNSRALTGVSTIYEVYHLCLIALRYTHPNQVPFISVNTCEHELLHVLMRDIFVSNPRLYQTGGREIRIDFYATLLWLSATAPSSEISQGVMSNDFGQL
jgi:hypothetical protein